MRKYTMVVLTTDGSLPYDIEAKTNEEAIQTTLDKFIADNTGKELTGITIQGFQEIK